MQRCCPAYAGAPACLTDNVASSVELTGVTSLMHMYMVRSILVWCVFVGVRERHTCWRE